MLEIEKIKGIEKGKLLGPLTTFQIGGPADFYYELKDIMLLPRLIEVCLKDGLPYIILGWGSNVIFSDLGFRGLVIHNLARGMKVGEKVMERGRLGEPNYRPAGQLLEADAGTLLSQIIQFSLKNGLTGMEKLMGVPGTIGGAVRGNAGAYGLETRHLLEKALIYCPPEGADTKGVTKEVDLEYFKFDYRHSTIKQSPEVVLKAWLRLVPGDTTVGLEEVKKIITARAGRHPAGKSAGSFFKNPSGNSVGEGWSAGYLIDQCGFKGRHIGGAFISEKHCNFLMNDGTATFNDVRELCLEIQQEVKAKFGIKLEREVALIGETGYIND